MASRTLQVVLSLAATVMVSGRQHVAAITSKGHVTSASARKVVKSHKDQPSSASGWKVVRSRRSKRATVAKKATRAYCVARKDARYLDYPKDSLYKFEDFPDFQAANESFKNWTEFGQLAAVFFSNGVQEATYGSYFDHDLFNMALVCGISLNGTTPWIIKQSCQAGEVVDESKECQIAGPFLGAEYNGIVSSTDDPPGCHINSNSKSIYNVLTNSTSTGNAICRVTTTTTTPLPKTVYTGVLSKLASFSSSAYDGLEGYVSLEATAHGIGTFVKMDGTHGGAHPGELRNAMRSQIFKAHLHAKKCNDDDGGLHYIDAPSGEENWPEVTCDDNADCFGKDHNAWVPTSITSLSIVVHDTPNNGAKAFCADFTECPSKDVHKCVELLENATSSMISQEVGASATESDDDEDEAETPNVLKVATTVTTTALAVKPQSTTSVEMLKVQTTATTTALAVKQQSTTATAAAPIALKEDPCKDGHEFCGDWAAKGECGKNAGYMLVVCKSACNQCKSAPQQPVLAQRK